ncbi:MAG: CRISPR-associated helicase Cas3' [Pseudonocardiaceae bacterium]
MAEYRGPVEALRVELYAPVASFRDPLFPGVTRCLPVPPPATLRGMLAAATGRPVETVTLGVAAHAEGRGTDTETYHPIAADGTNPAISGRVRAVKGGATVRERRFLADLRVTLWIPAPEGERIAAALRRPVWGLRLGRSQDLVHIRALTPTTLEPAEHADVGHALAPADGHAVPQADTLRLADTVSPDRLRTSYATYLWCDESAGHHPVHQAYRDTDPAYQGGQQAVWLHDAGHFDEDGELTGVLAKSDSRSRLGRPERLTEHSATVRDAARDVADRIGSPGLLATEPRFWAWVEQAALLHDAGKVAESFQIQLRPGGQSWGHRHEVLSLAYVDLLTVGEPDRDRLMVATGVAFHHRPLSSERMGWGLNRLYPEDADDSDWERIFGRDPHPAPGQPRVQVTPTRHRELLSWLAGQLGTEPPPSDGPAQRLWQRARDLFTELHDTWRGPVEDPDEGLLAVLLQGAVTLADRSGSAHVPLQQHMPLPRRYLDVRLPEAYQHQRDAEQTTGHLVLLAPTGSGKTEAGLAWASRQLETMPGRPRLVWVLPYRASIDAAVDRFTKDLDAAPGRETPDVGILHATAARTLLTRATADDCAPTATGARKARDQVKAMRLFAQRVRVATPHQLLRAAIAGPRYSSVLLDQANCLIVLDELHAYDPAVFGRICAAMQLWERLGSRVAVLSATLAKPMIELIGNSITRPRTVRAPDGTAPDRHRLVLDDDPITAPASIQRVATWLGEGHSVLVVANTVATAQKLYAELAERARDALPDDPDAALLLHARFKSRDRAAIEARIKTRHPERCPGDPDRRGGGLVVSTQCLEVSLCLDFDRGVTELAPVEALAQRAGRVNRRGRHPDGPVEFRVHEAESALPYEQGAVDAARQALHRTLAVTPVISEQTIDTWLDHVYSTAWGQQWAATACQARDEFTQSFLTFTEPFDDRSEFAARLDEKFDTIEVLLAEDRAEYQELSTGHPLLAAGLLIPISLRQLFKLRGPGRTPFDRDPPVIDAPYDDEKGLDLSGAPKPSPPVDPVL